MASQDLVLNLLKGDKKGDETDYRDYLPVNMSGIIRPLFGVQGYMLEQPGLTQYGSGSGVDRRGIWNENKQQLFRISGTDLIEVETNGDITVLGTIAGTDTASLPYSFNTQGIVADFRFYLYDSTNGLVEVTDPDLGDPIDSVWVDGYYFFTDGPTLYHTILTDESSIDPLDFSTSAYSPDPTLGLDLTPDNKVIVFNRYSTEYFVNQANAEFAFSRIPTRAHKIGIVGTHCKAFMIDRHFIMGGRKEEDVGVHTIRIGEISKISSREIDKVINKYSEDELSVAVVEARVEDSYQYIIIHLKNETLLYNHRIAMVSGVDQAWSILQSGSDNETDYRAKFGVFEVRKGKWVYGDKIDSRMGILDDTVATHYDEIVQWTLNTPFIYLETSSVDELNIETIPGFTVTDDATVFVSITYDGITHGLEYTMQYGGPSDYGKRFIRYRFGYIPNWFAFKLRGTSRSRMAFSRAYIKHG